MAENGSTKSRVLEKAVKDYVESGWILMSRSRNLVQLRKPKQFNWGAFMIWLVIAIFLFGLPLIIYLIYYAVKKDEIVTLSVNDEGKLLVNGQLPVANVVQPTRPQTPEEKAKVQAANKKILVGLAIAGVVVTFLCIILSSSGN